MILPLRRWSVCKLTWIAILNCMPADDSQTAMSTHANKVDVAEMLTPHPSAA